MRYYSKLYLVLAMIVAVAGGAARSEAQSIWVRAAVQDEIYVGEPFQFQIVIDGYEGPGEVDLGVLESYSPRELGGRNLSQSVTTIINGKMTQEKTLRYVMSYQLTSVQAGRRQIPSLSVAVEGQRYQTNPIDINVLQPGTTDKIGLEMSLSQTECYVGQPITLLMKWYVGVNLGGYSFNIPVLHDRENFVIDETPAPPGTGGDLIQINLGNEQIVGRRKDGVYQGSNCLEITFSKILIPTRSGTIPIGGARVICNVEVASRGRSRSLFDDFFRDDIFGRREYERFASSAPGLTLEVKSLPVEGRPADFNGLVGRYSIATTASPVEVNVGDPITLTIIIGGELLKLVEMPDLSTVAGMADYFKIPTDRSAPKMSGNRKVFTQTIRAAHDEVREIPPIPISYFDVDAGKYLTAYSEAIPLEVAATKVVTANQALSGQPAAVASEIEAVRVGLAANYEGPELLRNTAFSPLAAVTQPGYIALWSGPLALLVVSGLVQLRRRSSPVRQQARRKARSGRQAVKRLKRIDDKSKTAPEEAADIMRRYVGDRYNQTAQSLTARDCRALLMDHGGNQELVERFGGLLERCEQSRFAGGLTTDDPVRIREIIEVIKALDKQLAS